MPARHLKRSARRTDVAERVRASLPPAWAAICAAVARIPRGSVGTYGGVALAAGLPGRARLVGTVLKRLPDSLRLPWHRVITASGKLAFPEQSTAYLEQRRRLAREGVTMERGRIDLSRFGWPHAPRSLDRLLWGRRE